MLSSMTGFATYQTDIEEAFLNWEIKSVNHRYLDLSIRLPEICRSYEGNIRERIKSMISRGKVDVQLKLKEKQEKQSFLTIDMVRLNTIVDQVNTASKSLTDVGTLSWDTLLNLPDILVEGERQFISKKVLLDGLEQVLIRLRDNRRSEGKYLQNTIEERLGKLMQFQKSIAGKTNDLSQQLKTKLQKRLSELALSVDEQRLMQEIALILTKMDVAEEIDRIGGHCQQIQAALKMDEPVGRQLDFLMQELNREVNTLGVKIEDSTIRTQTVEMKVLIEQMREQIQNVE